MTDAVRVKNDLHEWQVQHAATCAQPPAARPAPPQQGYGGQHPQGW
jgi:hypothetical protein